MSAAVVGFAFDGKNLAAQAEAKAHAGRMITRVSEETRDGIRVLIQRSIDEGIAPVQAARIVRDMVGLTAPHAAAVMNYRRELYSQGLLTPDRIDSEVNKYASKLIRSRALMIARTEVMGALNAGRLEGWRRAVEAGLVGEGSYKRWTATPDEKTCEICDALHGEAVPLEGAFPGGYLMPPAHPNCRCSAALVPPTNRAVEEPEEETEIEDQLADPESELELEHEELDELDPESGSIDPESGYTPPEPIEPEGLEADGTLAKVAFALLMARIAASGEVTPAERDEAEDAIEDAYDEAAAAWSGWDEVPNAGDWMIPAASLLSADAATSPAAFYAEATAFEELGFELPGLARTLYEQMKEAL